MRIGGAEISALALLSALALMSTDLGAQTRGCADDAAKLCPGVAAAKGALLACLKPHAAELSPSCRATIERLEKKRDAMTRRRPQVNTVRSALRTPSPAPSPRPSPVAAATP